MTDDVTASAGAAQDAVFFDGTTNRKRRVTLRLASTLGIVEDGRTLASWPYDQIRRADGPSARLRLRCLAAPPLARLELEHGMMTQALAARCPLLDAGRGPRQTWRIVSWSLAAVASIVGLAIYGIPLAADRLAPLVPTAFETRIGNAVDGQVRTIIGGTVCSAPEGREALAALTDKLRQAGALEVALDVQVLSTRVPNALALPGGRIYLLNGLLQRARNADELAGILAHEIGHIRHRDSLRKMIQNGGTSFLVGLLLGDVIGGSAVIFAARSLIDASYSREAERGADAFAIEVMHKLGRSPRPMGEFLFRITGPERNKSTKESTSLFSSHPVTEERLEAMKKGDRPVTGADLLSATQWQALKGICGTPRSGTPRSGTLGSDGGKP